VLFSVGCTVLIGIVLAVPISMIAMGEFLLLLLDVLPLAVVLITKSAGSNS